MGINGLTTLLQEHGIDLSQETLWFAILHILFNPTYWNVMARCEYNGRALTRIAGGNAKLGCYFLALSIFTLGITRDYLYERALRDQPVHPLLDTPLFQAAGALSFAAGNVLVLTSMWALGITGTYLGDYFGILMSERVTGFPFNVSNNPMYHGSALCFLGTALWYGKPTGLLVTVIVHYMYKIACMFEEPYTDKIYAEKAKQDAQKEK